MRAAAERKPAAACKIGVRPPFLHAWGVWAAVQEGGQAPVLR